MVTKKNCTPFSIFRCNIRNDTRINNNIIKIKQNYNIRTLEWFDTSIYLQKPVKCILKIDTVIVIDAEN